MFTAIITPDYLQGAANGGPLFGLVPITQFFGTEPATGKRALGG
jgi:hypothetical protein